MNGDAERSYRVTVRALGMLALVLLAYPLARLFWDFEIDNTEGWNAYYQLRALAGESLYASGSPYFFNNYPPLSFYLVGVLSKLVGDVNLAGRLVSYASTAAVCLAVRSIVRSAGGSRLDGWFAAVTCALFFACLLTDHVGKNNPQLLAHAFVLGGLAVYLGGEMDARRAALTALLFSAGMLVKHSLVCLPLLIAVDILVRGPGRARLAYFATGTALAAASGVLLGPPFFAQLLASRTWDLTRAFLFTTEILGQFQAPLAVVGLGLLAARRTRPAGLILAYLVCSLALGAGFSGGAGTDVNVYFDAYVALAIGAGLVLHLAPYPMARPVMALVINAGVLAYAPAALGRFGVEALGELANREAMFHDDVAYLKGIKGTALCQSHLLCLRAGKPAFYDPINSLQAMTMGRLPADTLTGMLKRREIAVVELVDPPKHTEDDNPGALVPPARWQDFQDEVFAVLREEYELDRVSLSGRFYRPKKRDT
ncbi:glycosyltransferase 87 family protein [Magnetospirillum sp. XM-1]|uniref:glycosyltransferase 87 family protein n=1 Tax=Magnetospirillum sp. XM-1 TaxID=1663591 RepID=UPI001E58F056|nr:glycosyltransferase 87 family protein [Magnetospirillum sp. XM-1]